MLNFNILMENPQKDETVHSVIRLIVPNKEIPQTLDCIWDKVIDWVNNTAIHNVIDFQSADPVFG